MPTHLKRGFSEGRNRCRADTIAPKGSSMLNKKLERHLEKWCAGADTRITHSIPGSCVFWLQKENPWQIDPWASWVLYLGITKRFRKSLRKHRGIGADVSPTDRILATCLLFFFISSLQVIVCVVVYLCKGLGYLHIPFIEFPISTHFTLPAESPCCTVIARKCVSSVSIWLSLLSCCPVILISPPFLTSFSALIYEHTLWTACWI